MKKIIISVLLLSLIGLTSCTDKVTETATDAGSGSAVTETAADTGSAVTETAADAVVSEESK